MLPYKTLVTQTDYLVAVPMYTSSIMHKHLWLLPFHLSGSIRDNAASTCITAMFPIGLNRLNVLSKQIKALTLQFFLSLSLSLFLLVLYICMYIHTIILKYSCWTFTLEFLIHMWIFLDPMSSAWRNVSMWSNISYRNDTRQTIRVWKCGFVPT
jgi:hypothetical protein